MTNKITFPEIGTLTESSHRPFWSVMIPTLNGARYLEKTLASVLSQAIPPEEMQIEVVDDGSDDETENIVYRVGKGRISFHRNVHRLGLVGNWNACIERATGNWVHILHQDDVILAGFYWNIKKAIEVNADVGAAFCRIMFMDENGHWLSVSALERETTGVLENWLEKIAVVQLIQFPSMVVRRSVFEELGGFCAEAHYAADWEMWTRIARYYPVCYVTDVLACYRVHTESETSRLVKLGQNMIDTRTAIQVFKSYLPEQSAENLTHMALEKAALYSLIIAQDMVVKGYLRIGLIQAREALRTSCSLKVLQRLVLLIILSVIKKALKNYKSIYHKSER